MTPSIPRFTIDSPILIIGAGPAGLTLAQALRKREIPFQIFERDAHPDARWQGWAIALHWIIPHLIRHFPDDLPPIDTISHLYEFGKTCEGAIFKGHTCEEVSRFSSLDGKDFVRVSRPKLREWLSTNIKVEWGKEFLRFETHESGVTAHFVDGTTAEGSMLIGADGGHSKVRKQLLGPEKGLPEALPMDVYVGTVMLSKAQYEYQFQNFARSFYIVESPEVYLFTGLRSISEDGETAEYYWMVFRHLTDDERLAKDRAVESWSNQDILQAALKSIKTVNPRFTEVVWLTKPENIHRPMLLMENFLPPTDGFGGHQVTLLGDAAHKMTPFKGEGGNHAMKDSIELIELLDSGVVNPLELIRRYEEVIIERGREAVQRTRAAGMDWVNVSAKEVWQEKIGK